MRRVGTVLAAAAVCWGSVGVASGAGLSVGRAAHGPTAVAAESCSSGYTHAVIGGEQKCLRAGEYCAHSDGRQYRRYGFVCERVHGTYRLEDR